MYNPYDLVDLIINGHQSYGRPIVFDSEVSDSDTMLNAFGEIVRPVKIASTCPDCGQGLELDIKVNNPPFHVNVNCYMCNTQAVNVPESMVASKSGSAIDPFINPIRDGRMSMSDIDPLLYDASYQLSDVDSSVYHRLGDLDCSDSDQASSVEQPNKREKSKKSSKSKKLGPIKAIGITEEVDLDDGAQIE
jgi:hypothetical protein